MKLMQRLGLKNEPLIYVDKNLEYNWIYGRLVKDENDLVGAIAYVLYKQHKIEFINKVENESGASPTDQQWAEFHRSTCLDSSILNYQSRADNLVNEFLRNVLTKHIEQLEAQGEARMAAAVELATNALKEKITELEGTINSNHSIVNTEIANKKSILNRLGEAFLNILYGIFALAIIGGIYSGYKWTSELNSKTEKIVGISE